MVVGAGMAGLVAAKMLSAHFDHVTVLERDELPNQAVARAGTPQSRHPHALLLSGQQCLEQVFPGFEKELEAAGGLRLRVGLDVWWERPGFDPYPVRDLGLDSFFMSRPLLEYVCRRMVEAQSRVSLRENCRVEEKLSLIPSGAPLVRFAIRERTGKRTRSPPTSLSTLPGAAG